MARLVDLSTFGVTRNQANEITNVRYFAPSPLFGQTLPESVDAIVMDDCGPYWLGNVVNLGIDGDEVVMNCQMGTDAANDSMSRRELLEQIAEFIRVEGVIEVSEQVICPDSLEYTNRVHVIPAVHYASDVEFVMDSHAQSQSGVY
ncbi:hypothetical protein PSH49_21505 [Pseudoalteromonas sp. GABNS16G]|uniref:hypothetical protein n=2 Tax=unclassified Pseudoalteromonas TaxID=194690 RepID=UPI0023597E94|nr:hypothetical protein [Pseudoalteromonas sp. GABNS16G]MDC9603158.1 hypothetical protein [Pseudoalteromonas sp. GABNS16G]